MFVGARLLFINQSQILDRLPLGVDGVDIYGRAGHPFELSYYEQPPQVRCRVSFDHGIWQVEDVGEEKLSLLNDQLVSSKTALTDWDEIRCGPHVLLFDALANSGIEIGRLRQQLLNATKDAVRSEEGLKQRLIEQDKALIELKDRCARQQGELKKLHEDVARARRELTDCQARLLTCPQCKLAEMDI